MTCTPPAPRSRDKIFRAVFQDVRFPYLAIDLGKLCEALERDPHSGSSVRIPLAIGRPDRRDALVAGLRGLIRGIDVPTEVFAFLRRDLASRSGGLGMALAAMGEEAGSFAVTLEDGVLEWQETTLWPVAYSTLFDQLVGILQLHSTIVSKSQSSAPDLTTLSEYPRHMPTHLHYAVASLAAWLAGTPNIQYLAYFATHPQIRDENVNTEYARRINYLAEDAAQLDKSGIVALPATLMMPLLSAQGDSSVFGSIGIDEANTANMPKEAFFSTASDSPEHPGFLMDKYYRAPFRARSLDSIAYYGQKDVLRDHYESFYKHVRATSLVRCKHFCAPLIEVSSTTEMAEHVACIPLHDDNGVFFRGQTRLYTLRRTSGVRALLFAESCSVEPSLITAAARQPKYDYDSVHFALKYFIQSKILGGRSMKAGNLLMDWRSRAASPDCDLDHAVMALAQHYGLPTHGLDVTRSLDVAVWFATNRFTRDVNGLARYRRLGASDWPEDRESWPVVFVCQCVTHTMKKALHDCHDLAGFGLHALRPERQSARFFLGGHSDHQNRLAETVVCVFRLCPEEYATSTNFECLFPGPADDPAYSAMIEFARIPEFSMPGVAEVVQYHDWK